MTPTADDIFGTDTMWDLVCRFEDGDPATPAELRALSDHDRAIYTEEIDRIIARDLEMLARKDASKRQAAPRIGITCLTGPDYEGRVLAQAERRYFTA